jgi:short-subunit dehydrogenase
MYNYKNKCALITGGSSGIGLAIATGLAERGANLILVARSEKELNYITQELSTKYNVKVIYFVCDLSQNESSQHLFIKIKDSGYKIDILVNNAGFGISGLFHEDTTKHNQEMIAVNINALVLLTHLFLPQMIENKSGLVINIGSIAAFQPNPYMASYGATKAFVLNFTQALGEEYATFGIKFLVASPGVTKTKFFTDDINKKNNIDTPEMVANDIFYAISKNKRTVVCGKFSNKISTIIMSLMPSFLSAKISGSFCKNLHCNK